MVRIFTPPIYCYHEIVHNKIVVERFRKLGVIFVDSIDEVPEGAPVMLSAHGSAPDVVQASTTLGHLSVNAVCPLVTKVHHEVKVRSQRGYQIIYVGHRNHDEAIGTMAVAPDAVSLIETKEDLDALGPLADDVAMLSQTTLSMDEWSDIRSEALERYPNLWMPGRSDLCFATTNRQTALRAMAERADAIVVIGSKNSSNTMALEKVARGAGVARVYRVNTAEELPHDLSGVVGVTAGASAPDELVEEVIAFLSPTEGVEPMRVIDEDEYFPPPPELRDLLRRVTTATALAFGTTKGLEDPTADDKDVSASRVLADLGH
jgi:4-hydroxy-3-methylbut-2-enyl diphosphate reductase